jgi:lysozyme
VSQYTPGIDVSRWQGEINWKTVANQGYKFAVIRASVGRQYTDPRFYTNWDGAKAAGLLVSAYHVVKPNHPASAQVEQFFSVLDDRQPDLPPVLDVEMHEDLTPAQITTNVKECARLVEETGGRKPMIYTGKWFWDDYVLPSPDWAQYDLWTAHYEVPAPSTPRDWTSWTFWQYSETGSVSGVTSHNTDLNWFNGSYEDLLAYIKRTGGEVAPAEVVEGAETGEAAAGASTEVVPAGLRLRVINPTLKIRSGPGIFYDHIGNLHDGQVVPILAIEGKDVWIKIGPGQWAALAYQGHTYMRLD